MKAWEKKLLLERIEQDFNGELPLAEASTIPTHWYSDPLIYQAERMAVFNDSWQLACRAEEVSAAGSFVTLEIAGEPVIVIRDIEDKQLRAFTNVCRHRAAKVETAACGTNATKLRCHYHGWTYDTKGNLIGVPEFGGVCGFEKNANPLPSWQVDTWGPYVFVRSPLAGSRESLTDFLSPLPELCANLGLERMKFVKRVTYELKCNWKIFVDNYLDGCYHCNTLHPCLFGAIDYKNYRTECHDNVVLQISPLKKAEDADVGEVRKGRDAYYAWIWPNFMLNVYEGIMDMNRVLPLGHNRCLVEFDFFFENVEGEEQQRLIQKSLEIAHEVQMQDAGICEEVESGMESNLFSNGRFSVRREEGGYYFHKLLAAKLREFAVCPTAGDRLALPV